jgi:hypothetical protein
MAHERDRLRLVGNVGCVVRCLDLDLDLELRTGLGEGRLEELEVAQETTADPLG